MATPACRTFWHPKIVGWRRRFPRTLIGAPRGLRPCGHIVAASPLIENYKLARSLRHQHLGDVRSFTLIPTDALRAALSTFGCTERSEALVAALGIERPDGWEDAEVEGAVDPDHHHRTCLDVL